MRNEYQTSLKQEVRRVNGLIVDLSLENIRLYEVVEILGERVKLLADFVGAEFDITPAETEKHIIRKKQTKKSKK